jgi:hypothetical protein
MKLPAAPTVGAFRRAAENVTLACDLKMIMMSDDYVMLYYYTIDDNTR